MAVFAVALLLLVVVIAVFLLVLVLRVGRGGAVTGFGLFESFAEVAEPFEGGAVHVRGGGGGAWWCQC